MDYYLFIVSSLNHPIYREIQQERSSVLKKYNIPYSVLINEETSPLEDSSIPTVPPMREDEIYYPMGGYNPGMTQKFLYAVKMYFRSFNSYQDIPNYIVRINATVFIHFPALQEILNKLPETRVLAGPCYDSPVCNSFVVGMLMIFSKDVLWKMLKDKRIYEKKILTQNDDVALSLLAQPYSSKYDLMQHFIYPDEKAITRGYDEPDLKAIDPWTNQKWFFRIWSSSEDRKTDKKNWILLKKYFEKQSPRQHSEKKKSPFGITIFIIIMIIGIFFLFGSLILYVSLRPPVNFQNTRKS